MRRCLGLSVLLFLLTQVSFAEAATLPDHAPLSVHVISDEVNPHGLSDAELTQPGDISAALNREGIGLELLAPVGESASGCIDEALTALEAEEIDVVIYFAHRGATTCASAAAQSALDSALNAHLERGGGVVVFHHGLYEDPAKTTLLQLFGGSASGIAWDEQVGQRVFNVGGDHFVTSNGLVYEGEAVLTGNTEVPSGTFPYFDNIPDERYPNLTLLSESGETRELLFATDTAGTRVLGYALKRAGWAGSVVAYQPGEYQPRALDDPDGQGLQILLNAILYSVGRHAPGEEAGTGGQSGAGGESGTGGETSNGGELNTGGSSSNGGQSTDTGGGGGESTTAGGSDGNDAGGSSAGGSSSSGGAAAGGSTSGGADAGNGAPADSSESSSGCGLARMSRPSPWFALLGLWLSALLVFRRWRSTETV